jgi:parvulin-like peptidyl-prolyl isomerase
MSKKNADREKEEEKDLEDEEEDESEEEEEEDEEDEEEDEEAHTASASTTESRRSREPRARARRADEHADEHDDHGHDDAEAEDDDVDPDDPYWWTPHAVMSVLVLIGVLGFFGMFNRLVATLMGRPVVVASENKPAAPAEPARAAAAATPPAQREEFGAKHLLVQYKGSMRAAPTVTRTEDEAKARAIEAMKKAKGGTKFEDVVKEYSDEPGAGARGGDLGKFKKGQMVPEFQAAVEKLKVGEVSDLVKTPFGYHVILRTQ